MTVSIQVANVRHIQIKAFYLASTLKIILILTLRLMAILQISANLYLWQQQPRTVISALNNGPGLFVIRVRDHGG